MLAAVLSLVGAVEVPLAVSWSLMVVALVGLLWGGIDVWPRALAPTISEGTELDRAKLQNDIRGSLISGTTIATALLAAVLAWNQLAGTRADSIEQQRATEQQQRATEQQLWIAGQQLNAQAYNTAVTLLAGDTVNERSAGVLAVQRMGVQGAKAQLAGEEMSDYPLTSHAAIIMLTDHIATHAPLGEWTPSTATPSLRRDRADVQHSVGAVSAITRYRVTQGARLTAVDLRGVELQRATLDSAFFDGSDLSYADSRGESGAAPSFCASEFRGAKLRYAQLPGANFQLAHLDAADVTGANLRGAHFEGADLSNVAGLETADLDGATYDTAAAKLAPTVPWQEYGMVLTTEVGACAPWHPTN